MDKSPNPHDDFAAGQPGDVSRRSSFNRGGTAASGLALTDGLGEATQAISAENGASVLGPGAITLFLTVNGRDVSVRVDPAMTLAQVLRDGLGMTGTKIGCDRGACSACTVWLDAEVTSSCMTLALDARGRTITTIEGLAQGDVLHPVQQAFVENDAMQCGFCTPGMVMSCAALVNRDPDCTLDDVKQAISGHLCRCGAYPNIFKGAMSAAGVVKSRRTDQGDARLGEQTTGTGQKPSQAAPSKPSEAATNPPQTPAAPPGPFRRQPLLYGVVGGPMETVTRRVPIDEPPPLPVNAELKVIGKPIARFDAVQKVTGQARYTFDVQLPHMLYGRRVVSDVPHARVLAIDTSAAERYPGVRAVHVLDRQLLVAQLRDPSTESKQRYPIVRYLGQPLAAIAADTQRAADEAAALVKVSYERLPHVITLDEAMKSGAPPVFPGPTEQAATAGGGGATPGLAQRGNVRGPDRGTMFGLPRGDVAKGLAAAAVIVDAEYRTQVQTHVPMETHGMVADWTEDELTIYASTQFTKSVRDEAAELFGLPNSRVRVISDFTGGGFGAKYGIGNLGLLAIHLSKKAGAPVRLVLDRREEHVSVGNRPDSLQRLKVGATRDGALTAIALESYGSGGVAGGAGVGFAHATLYPCPNVIMDQHDVFTNAGPCAAFRAPGQVQGIFGLEQTIDELAERLQIDPLALRDRIDVSGSDDARARHAERRLGADLFGWTARRTPNADSGPLKRGLGVAQSQWASLVYPPTSCEVRISGDGSVEAFSAAQDIGTGTRTVLAQVVAEELGLRAEQVASYIGDTRYPIGPPSGGSRVTGSLTPAARNAAWRAARDFAGRLAPVLGVRADAITFADGHVGVPGDTSAWLPFKDAVKKAGIVELSQRAERRDDYDGYMMRLQDMAIGKHGIGGVQFVEVVVDTETGAVKVARIVAVHDCGRPINPMLTESQIHGGIIQGVSYALYEERHMDPGTGLQLNANIDQYKIVGSRDVPSIEVHLLEQLTGQSSTDARGVAEPANVATAAAIANAFYNATGKRIRTLPMTPANVLASLRS